MKGGDSMFTIKDADLNVLLNQFYSFYFVDYLEDIISDDNEEYSTVTLIKGMEYFIGLCSNLGISLPFCDVESYILNNYEDGKEIYEDIRIKYLKEIKNYHNSDHDFKEEHCDLDFI